jgi:hypothetical protein
MDIITYPGTDGKRVTVKDAVNDPVAFTLMNDSLVDLIKVSERPELKKSQAILRAIERREIYGHCGRVNMPTDMIESVKKKDTTEEMIAEEIRAEQPDTGLEKTFTVDDIIVEFVKVHHGRGEDNPVDDVYFFKKDGVAATRIKTDVKLQATLPQIFCDRAIRVFCKDRQYMGHVSLAFVRGSPCIIPRAC